jgi:7,8-dihydroneopterin aldolase/epimerase/oxygenase
MGIIRLEQMEFYAYHGHYEEEKVSGNVFYVDLEIEADLEKPSRSDNLNDTVNYQKAYEIVKTEMRSGSNLLENIANRILENIYASFHSINKCTVRISKVNPPVGGKLNRVSVTLSK